MSSTPQNITNNDTLSKRRRFQTPITSFFSSAPTPTDSTQGDDETHHHYSAATYSPTPAVPAKVQASLLSVGMRVRKSVAEGYKTTKELEKQQLTTYTNQAQAMHYPGGNRIELAPFCGMSKSDDYPVQQLSRPAQSLSNASDIITDDGDAFSLPPSSQESTGSFVPSFTAQKRSYDSDLDDDEVEEQIAQYPGNINWAQGAGRTILAPNLGQQKRRFFAMQSQDRTVGQMDIDDFEEPSFLRRREEVDSDYVFRANGGYEVQMGGA